MPGEPQTTEPQLDRVDRELLNALQAGVPIALDPLAELAGRLAADPDEVVQRVRRMKGQKIIRQISAIFDTAALGYASSLAAAKFVPDRLGYGSAVISGHPGVTHNYRRNHEYNLWFTLAVPPDSRLGLVRTAAVLASESGAGVVRLMPALRTFKIGVKLDMTGGGGNGGEHGEVEEEGYSDADRSRAARYPLSERDRAMVRALQEDLPVSRRPFRELAERAGVEAGELLSAAERFLAHGQMRRFAAVLHHRAAGFTANAMGVWSVPDERVEQVGRQLAGFKSVSHCYLRPTFPDWPYNVFTMVHGRSRQECSGELELMRQAVGVERMEMLYSVEEYKKVRLRYFTGEIEAWERERAG